jgi:hypothetical protein
MQQNSTIKNILRKPVTLELFYWILLNLFTLWGVWFNGWDAKIIFLVYCLESVIIGIYTLLKIFLASLYSSSEMHKYSNGKTPLFFGLFLMLFFIFHFGLFTFVQLSIFLGVANLNNHNHISVISLFSNPTKYLPLYAQLLLLSFFITHGLIVIKNFVITRLYKSAKLPTLMFEPYGRIIIQQIVVILGSMTLIIDKKGKILILIFIVIKIFFDNWIDYKKFLSEKMVDN